MLKLQVRDQLMMRNKIRQILWLLCCLPVLTGCIGEDDYANDPRGNFEQLWKIIDEQYCFLDTKGIDWDAVHDEYSKLIIPSMSNDDLFDILSQNALYLERRACQSIFCQSYFLLRCMVSGLPLEL